MDVVLVTSTIGGNAAQSDTRSMERMLRSIGCTDYRLLDAAATEKSEEEKRTVAQVAGKRFPALIVKGELIGGKDDVQDMIDDGILQKKLQ